MPGVVGARKNLGYPIMSHFYEFELLLLFFFISNLRTNIEPIGTKKLNGPGKPKPIALRIENGILILSESFL